MLDWMSGLLGGGGGSDAAAAPQFSPQVMQASQAYGLPPEMVQQTQRQYNDQMLMQAGATLLSAGQAGPIGQRGQILSQIGQGQQPMQTQLLNAAQMRIYADTLKEKQAQREADRAMQDTLSNIVQGKSIATAPTPTGGSSIAAATGDGQAAPAASQGGMAGGLNISPQMAQMLLQLRPEQRRDVMQQVIASKLKGAEWSQPFKIGDSLFQSNTSTGEMKQVGGSHVTINNADNKATDYDIKQLEEMRKGTADLRQVSGPLEIAHSQLYNGLATGPIESATLPLRNMAVSLGLMSKEDADKVGQQQLFQAVSKYMVPRMRVAGSGSSSDFDARMFEAASPTLEKSEDGNLLTTAYLRQNIRQQQDYVQAADRYFRQNKSLAGFDDWADKNVAPLFHKVDGQPSPDALDKKGVRIGDMFYSAEAAARGVNGGFIIRRK